MDFSLEYPEKDHSPADTLILASETHMGFLTSEL